MAEEEEDERGTGEGEEGAGEKGREGVVYFYPIARDEDESESFLQVVKFVIVAPPGKEGWCLVVFFSGMMIPLDGGRGEEMRRTMTKRL